MMKGIEGGSKENPALPKTFCRIFTVFLGMGMSFRKNEVIKAVFL